MMRLNGGKHALRSLAPVLRLRLFVVICMITVGCSSNYDRLYSPGFIALTSTPTPTSTVDLYPCDAAASPFGGGSGTVGDPYTVCTRAHLAAIAGAYLSKVFYQTADIDLGGVGNPWAPIAAVAFTGTYDGNSKTISNLYYNTAGVSDVGLFKLVTTGAVIKNVVLTGVSITGTGTRTGALVGRLTASTVQNCSVAGTITVTVGLTTGGLVGLAETASSITSSSSSATVSGVTRVGGLVGMANSNTTITSSYATGPITGSSTLVGGLAGGVTGTSANDQVQSSYATGSVTCTTCTSVGGLIGAVTTAGVLSSYATGNVVGQQYVGGLVGSLATNAQISTSYYSTGTVSSVSGGSDYGGLVGNAASSTILKSYSTANVNAADATVLQLGGLVGNLAAATIQNSYAQGNLTGSGDNVGGLVGSAATLTLTNSYSSGLVTTAGTAGGLVGVNAGGVFTITNSYWDTTTSAQGASAAGTGMITALMKDYNNFTGWDFAATWNGAGYGGGAATYPYLR